MESGVLWFPWLPVVTVTVVAAPFFIATIHAAFDVFFLLAPISFYSSTTFRPLLRVGLRL